VDENTVTRPLQNRADRVVVVVVSPVVVLAPASAAVVVVVVVVVLNYFASKTKTAAAAAVVAVCSVVVIGGENWDTLHSIHLSNETSHAFCMYSPFHCLIAALLMMDQLVLLWVFFCLTVSLDCQRILQSDQHCNLQFAMQQQ